MLTIALRLITIELASAIGSLAASGLVRSVFGALPVLRRIFHVYVLVKAFWWPLTILRALSIALTFLMISIALEVLVTTTRFSTSALPSVSLCLGLTFTWLHLLRCLSFIDFVVGSLLKIVPVAAPALATVVVVFFTISFLFATVSSVVEIFLAGSVVMALGLSLIDDCPD